MQLSFLYLFCALVSESISKVRGTCVCGHVPGCLQTLSPGHPIKWGQSKQEQGPISTPLICLTHIPGCSLRWGVDASLRGGRVVIFEPSITVVPLLYPKHFKSKNLSARLGALLPRSLHPPCSLLRYLPISSSDEEPKKRCVFPGSLPTPAPQNCWLTPLLLWGILDHSSAPSGETTLFSTPRTPRWRL